LESGHKDAISRCGYFGLVKCRKVQKALALC
jgi:hypothetical protein